MEIRAVSDIPGANLTYELDVPDGYDSFITLDGADIVIASNVPILQPGFIFIEVQQQATFVLYERSICKLGGVILHGDFSLQVNVSDGVSYREVDVSIDIESTTVTPNEPPQFQNSSYSFSLSEDAAVPHELGSLSVLDGGIYV